MISSLLIREWVKQIFFDVLNWYRQMNSIKIFALIVLGSLLLHSCKSEESPETVTRKFANHFAAAEYQQATQYGTESTKQLLEMMESLASVGFYLPEEDEIVTITDQDVTCEITGESAICSYLEYGERIELNLIKADNKWLIDIALDDFTEDESWYEESDEEDEWFLNDSILN